MELTRVEERRVHELVDIWTSQLVKVEGRRPAWGELVAKFEFYKEVVLAERRLQ